MPEGSAPPLAELEGPDSFVSRHIGIAADDEAKMLQVIGCESREALVRAVAPASIRRTRPLNLPEPLCEAAALHELRAMARRNVVLRSFIGQGYHGCITPPVIQRNVLENPAWYTAYTPYQAEISQGRLEALLNFQTLVTDLTGMAIAGSSMLDEATAAAEAMTLALRAGSSASRTFFVADDVLPQTIEVIRTRAQPLGIQVEVARWDQAPDQACFAALFQYPALNGEVHDLGPVIDAVQARGGLAIVAADLLALTLLKPPGELGTKGADVAVGSTQRLGMPMGNGGPHAGYLATRDAYRRALPGRLVGVSRDAAGHMAYRLALQTREQHIRREKATSNLCTAQVLPAVVAGMYAVYHGPDGLRRIALRVARYTAILAQGLRRLGRRIYNDTAFDTLRVMTGERTGHLLRVARHRGFNLRAATHHSVGITLDETTTRADIAALWALFGDGQAMPASDALDEDQLDVPLLLPQLLRRSSSFLGHPVFNTHHCETSMLRYLRELSDRDLALDRTMIPLGSCTMKLNATSEMMPISWPEFANIHPFAPREQQQGYLQMAAELQTWLADVTGYAAVSLQPNAGSQGEFAGLLAIRAYHAARGEAQRTVCLIPESAHGTNPASAAMAGMKVVVTRCDAQGNVDLADLAARCEAHAHELAAVMITYPSTHGVFEPHVRELCELVHRHGGRVYVDGANMNALVGVAAPGEFGGDVSHLNLHKTFCIPHGGGGPGVGPVAVVADLAPYLPVHRTFDVADAAAEQMLPNDETEAQQQHGVHAVSAAPLGNALVLPISWMYCRMMGSHGLRRATETAILSANYVAARLAPHYPVLYTSGAPGIQGGGVAHECILDLRPVKDTSGVTAEDVAKRLIDYGFHAPTLSFPVPGTLMVEPTESEPLAELDRFCDAMIAIRHEIARVEQGDWPRDDNPLKRAPHTAEAVMATQWPHPWSREEAAFPVPALRRQKYWPPVQRIDNVHGDRNLMCSCPPTEAAQPLAP